MLIYSVFALYFVTTGLYWNIEDTYEILPVLKTPILLVIAILFLRIYRRIDSHDPFKRISLMVTIAWFLLTIGSAFTTLWWRDFEIPSLVLPPFLIAIGLQPLAWILMVYSMVIRKAAMLTWKKRIAKDTVTKWTEK